MFSKLLLFMFLFYCVERFYLLAMLIIESASQMIFKL